MNKKSFFACVVGYVVLFLKMNSKPLTTLKFLGDRFVITPPQRCLSGSDYEPVGYMFVLLVVWVRKWMDWLEWRKGKRRKGRNY